MLHVNEGHFAALLLGFGQNVQSQRGLTTGFRAVHLNDASAGHAAHAQSQIQTQTASGNGIQMCIRDSYMTKPFSVSELLARVEALCRRVSRTAGGDEKEKSSPLGMLTSGEFVLDENRRVLLKACLLYTSRCV